MLSPHKGCHIQYYSLDLPDIANALCRLERFNAQTMRAITIGEHLIHCYDLATALGFTDRLKQLILYHDVPEAYYGDIPTYVKRVLGTEARENLDKLDREIYKELGIAWPTDAEQEMVKFVDLMALTLEAEYGFDEINLLDWPPLYSEHKWMIRAITKESLELNEDWLTGLLTEYKDIEYEHAA